MKKILALLLCFIDKWINCYWISVFIFRNFQKIKYLKIQTYLKIQFFIFNIYTLKNRKFNIVYDYSNSPPTNGDFIVFLMLVKFLTTKKIKLNFYIIKDEFREDWLLLDASEKNELLKNHNKFIKILLDKKICNIKYLTWKQFKVIKNINFFNTFLYLNVVNRKNCYSQSINFLNFFNFDKYQDRKFLLSRKLFFDYIFKKKLPENFITFHARYQKNWQSFRNLTISEFDIIVENLTKKFPNYKIIVVTDKHGANYFKNNSKGSSNLSFSKDYSNSFYGDALLVLSSRFYYQIRGGGIGIIPMFSNVPYYIECSLNTEIMVSNNKLFSWQKSDQKFTLIRKYL